MTRKSIFTASTAAGLALALRAHTLLPPKVATHYGNSGIPDSYMSNTYSLLLWLGTFLFLALLFFSMPYLLKKTRTEWINLPNREYWLAPERRENTIRIMSDYMYIFGSMLNGFFIVILWLTVIAHKQTPVQLSTSGMLTALALLFAATAVWLIQLFRQFRLPRSEMK